MAQSVLDEMPERDVISWNSMVLGFTRANNMEQAYELHRLLPFKNTASWNTMVTGYAECQKIELARSFFEAMPEKNSVSYITMISAYSKYGDVESAKELHDQLGDKNDLISYNAMISCLAQNYRSKEALRLFEEILVKPDKMALSSVVLACFQLEDSKYWAQIKSYMRKLGIVMDDHLATSFVELYAKCGDIDKAYGVDGMWQVLEIHILLSASSRRGNALPHMHFNECPTILSLTLITLEEH